jgi:hypothetical protein
MDSIIIGDVKVYGTTPEKQGECSSSTTVGYRLNMVLGSRIEVMLL